MNTPKISPSPFFVNRSFALALVLMLASCAGAGDAPTAANPPPSAPANAPAIATTAPTAPETAPTATTSSATMPATSPATTPAADATSAGPVTEPSEWIDPATGHLIVRLSQEAGTASMYFHQNGYTPDGKKLLIFTPEGMATVNLETRKIDLVVPGYRALSMSLSNGIEVSRNQPVVYYSTNVGSQVVAMAVNLDTHESKQVAVLPPGAVLGGITSDEKTIIGIRNIGGGGRGATPAATATAATATTATANAAAPAPTARGAARGAAGGIQNKQIYTVDIATGETKSFFPSADNLSHDQLNHFECSPTDPNLILFAHEADWWTVDRIWTMHADGTGLKLMQDRTMPNEIAGHEFFSHDGQWVYYDLQTPMSAEFWIGGANTKTGEHVRYPILRSEWSVHYNVSWDGKMFSGDGGGPNSVANRTPDKVPLNPPQNGQWMYLFTPVPGAYETIKVNGEDVKVGKLVTEKLADLRQHNYGNGEGSRVEPNATFTSDDKWLTFRSNMEGELDVYAVEIAKATPAEIKKVDAEWAAYKAFAAKTKEAAPAK